MIEIWINCPDLETARKISEVLISKRRIACANIFTEIQSSYRWQGRIENAAEIPLVVKTREENFSLVVDAVKKNHPYETPGIIGVPVEFVNQDYLEWVYSETE
jgi:periplasmic divalent cation tolerance protein